MQALIGVAEDFFIERQPAGLCQQPFALPRSRFSSAAASNEFDEGGRIKPSSCYERIVVIMEELVRFTVCSDHMPGSSLTAIPSARPRGSRSTRSPIFRASPAQPVGCKAERT